MTKKSPFIFMVLFLILFSSVQSQTEKQIKITLEDCIIHAIKNNLGVAVEVSTPELADLSVSLAKEKFLPTLAIDFNRKRTKQASYSWLEASEDLTTSQTEYAVEVSQLIPTGGRISFSLGASRNESNKKFQLINPSYGSTLYFSLTQPLLRDFGFRTSRKDILIAQNNLVISENDLKNVLLETVCAVEEAYWNLVFSIETLQVRQQSLKLARDLLEKNQKEVDIGTLAPKEILSAQAEVAAREADILQAEAQVKDQKDLLKTLLNLADEESGGDLIPADKPSFEKKDRSLDEVFAFALKNRPDLQSSQVAIKSKELELSYAKNQLLPALNLNADYWSPGISGDQIIYLDNDPETGVVVGRVPMGVSRAFKEAFRFKYKNWSVYLSLDIPLNTVVSRAAHVQAKVSLEQAVARMKYQEQRALLEIKTALRAVDTNYERINAYRLARELAEKKLEAEESKLKAGLSTNFVVLQYQRDLATARTAELKAIIDYNLALSRLDKATGVSLKNRNITLNGVSRAGEAEIQIL